MSEIKITARHGWHYARIPQHRGPALRWALGTRSIEEARQLVRSARFREIALASRADALTREVWTRLLAGRHLTVSDARQAYCAHLHTIGRSPHTIRRVDDVLDLFFRHSTPLGPQPLAALEAAPIAAFVNQPGPQSLGRRTLWLSTLCAWLTWLTVDQRWLVRNPAADVAIRLENLTQEQLVPRPIAPCTEAEVRTLLSAVPRSDFWHGAILLAYHYGLRLGAVALLEDSNIVANRLRLYTRKGRRMVDEPLEGDVWTWLQEWRAHRPPSDLPHLFPAQAAIHESGSPLLSKQFARLLARHQIAGRSFHSLRKTAASRRWSAELDKLGDSDRRALMSLVAQRGFRAVQAMLAHEPGSPVTERHYLPTAPA